MTVLILGSGPNVIQARAMPRDPFETVVAINNAWQVRDDWDYLVHPSDFDANRMPQTIKPGQNIVTYEDYVPANNALGGIVYAGGTMAFSASYWALNILRPTVMAFLGCDMIYDAEQTHFYGTGTPDPLRDDKTLRSLEGKSARLLALAARQGCACINLSDQPSRLVFPRGTADDLSARANIDEAAVERALQLEDAAGYLAPSGKYWKDEAAYDVAVIDEIDAAWLAAVS